MRIALWLPRGMSFSPDGATAIDLCAWDFVRHSRYRGTTLVIGRARGPALPGVAFAEVGRHMPMLIGAAAAIRRHRPDLIVVHQHLPSAQAIGALFPSVPLLYHRHNYERARRPGFDRFWKRLEYRAVRRVVAVSRSVGDQLAHDWPETADKIAVVHNGLPMAEWTPASERAPEILFVGRAVPEKGVLEAAEAVRAALPDLPGWSATFMLTALREAPAYLARVRAALEGAEGRARLRTDVPFDEVKRAWERAEIGLVPSLWNEPFGRTALEALSGGAALITSGRGGLAEIAGEAAVTIDPGEPAAFAVAIRRLATDAPARAALASAGRARAEATFDITELSGQLDQEYEIAASTARDARP